MSHYEKHTFPILVNYGMSVTPIIGCITDSLDQFIEDLKKLVPLSEDPGYYTVN